MTRVWNKHMSVKYLVIDAKIDTNDDEFFEHFHKALDALAHQGMRLEMAKRFEGVTSICLTYSDLQERTSVKLWADYIASTRYLEVVALNQKTMSSIETVLRSYLRILDLDELIDWAKRKMEADPTLVSRVAFAAPENFDEKTYEFIMSALDHNSPDVRKHAAYAAGVLAWSEFAPALGRRLNLEYPGEVKSYVDTALHICSGE